MAFRSTKTAATRAFAAFVVVSFVLTSLSLTSTAQTTPSVPEIAIGTNAVLKAPGLNAQLCNPPAPANCVADADQGFTYTAVAFDEQTGEARYEGRVGWSYKLVQACAEQQTTGALFTLRFTYDYNATASRSALGDGAATATIRGRADGSSTPVTFNAATLNGGTSSGRGTLVPLSNVVITPGKEYVTTLTAESYAKLTDSLLPAESASASAGVTPIEVTLDFLDQLDPTITSAGTIPAAINGGGPDSSFLGYLNSTSARMYVDAHDQNVAGRAMSCVDRVEFVRAGNLQTVNFTYSQSRAETDSILGEGDHVATATVYDNAGRSVQKTLNFILDTTLPKVTVDISEPNATGKNGWYKAPAPKWNVVCERDPNGIGQGNTAPCDATDINQPIDGQWVPLGGGASFSPTVLDSETAQAFVRSRDKAGNWNLSATPSPIVKVDTLPPSVDVNFSTDSAFSNEWYRKPTWLNISCDGDSLSGCGLFETRVDGGAWGNQSSFSCTTDQLITVEYGIEDVAGNRVQQSKPFGCDFTNPALLNNTRLKDTVTHTNGTQAYARTKPTWTWDTGVDVVTNGVRSGIKTYEVQIVGVPGVKEAASGSYSDETLPDGEQCLSARAVDKAGNRGPWTVPLCVFVDRAAALLDWTMPLANSLYVEGTAVSVPVTSVAGVPVPGITTIVIGNIEVSVTARDEVSPYGGEASMLERVELILDTPQYEATKLSGAYQSPVSRPSQGCEAHPVEDCQMDGENAGVFCTIATTDVQSRTCTWRDHAAPGSDERADRFMYTRVLDRANHATLALRNYEKVRVAALEEPCNHATTTCNTIHHAKADPTDFASYLIYRATDPATIEMAANLKGTQTDIDSTKWTDTDLLGEVRNGETLYYKVVAVKTDGTKGVSFPTLKVRHLGTSGALSVEFV